jgi:hypothetical protein
MDPGLIKFVEFLDRNKIRATYRAIAEAADVPQRSVGSLLGDRCHLASWVVSSDNGEPTGYAEHEKHADLRGNSEIIRTGDDLVRRMRREPRH